MEENPRSFYFQIKRKIKAAKRAESEIITRYQYLVLCIEFFYLKRRQRAKTYIKILYFFPPGNEYGALYERTQETPKEAGHYTDVPHVLLPFYVKLPSNWLLFFSFF